MEYTKEELRRISQIEKGKATAHYKAWKRYKRSTPSKAVRFREMGKDPITPPLHIINGNDSIRAWNGLYKIWRRELHKYGGEEADEEERLRMDYLFLPKQYCIECKLKNDTMFECENCDKFLCGLPCYNKHIDICLYLQFLQKFIKSPSQFWQQ